jgi:hypothetical protein
MPHAACLVAIALLVAASGFAQDTPVSNTDYSKPTLMKILAADEEEHARPHRFHFSPGAVEFRALGMDWRVTYIPILMPLAGSRPTITNEWPDAFSLTGTSYASPPRTWDDRRAINAELRRINRLDRKRGKVVVRQ